jgi:hypothetical protein
MVNALGSWLFFSGRLGEQGNWLFFCGRLGEQVGDIFYDAIELAFF